MLYSGAERLKLRSGTETFRDTVPESLRYRGDFPVADRTWQVAIRANSAFVRNRAPNAYWWILPIGFTLTVLSALYCYTLVSQRRRAERLVHEKTSELKEREEYLTSMFQSMPVGMMLVDAKTHRIQALNPEGELLFGRPAAEVIGRECYELIQTQGRGTCPITDRGQEIDLSERILITGAGEPIPIIKTVKRIMLNGQPCLLEIFVDNRAQKEAEKALRQSEARFREMANLLPQTVCEVNREGTFTFVNKNALTIFGYTQEELDKGLNIAQTLVPEDCERAVLNIQRVMDGEDLGGVAYTAVRKDGSTLPALVYAGPIIQENKPEGIRIILIDITEWKRIEDVLRQREAYLKAILDNQPYLAWLKDREGRFLMVNDLFADACGRLSALDVVGKTDLDVWPENLAASYMADDREIMGTGAKKAVTRLVAHKGKPEMVRNI